MPELAADEVLALSKRYGGAFYLLDMGRFQKNYLDLSHEFQTIYPHFNIAYSYKTNYTPALCKRVNDNGGYAEVVSEMELELALAVGVAPDRIIWNGPIKDGKRVGELLLDGGTVNLDSVYEIEAVRTVAKEHPEKRINIGVRCNFDVRDGVISRFGFDVEGDAIEELFAFVKQTGNVRLAGIQCHYAKRSVQYWPRRARGMIDMAKRVERELLYLPDRIDIGGGLYGNMDDDLVAQFSCAIPTYGEYARAAASLFAEQFPHAGPELVIEPGTALVGDCMTCYGRVETIKTVRGKVFATVLGSQKNISMSGVNPPIKVIPTGKDRQWYENLDFVGYTCIEGDVLHSGYTGELSVGDFIAISNCGSYSVVMKPPFILPNFPIVMVGVGEPKVIKRQETFTDIFRTFLF